VGIVELCGDSISLVHVKNETINTAIDYALDIPLDAADGEYEVVLSAAGNGVSDTMTIYLKVASEEIGESKFEVEYPSQEGDADTTFSYSATLINNALSSQNYSFTTSAPQGWQVSIKPSGESTKVSALDVEARTTQASYSGAVAGYLSFDQSVLLIWPHLTCMLALTIAAFTVSYIAFMRQEIRA